MIHPTLPPRLIGIAGQRRHGKDTLAAMISHVDPRFEVLHFADPLKAMAAEAFGLNCGDFYHPQAKDDPFNEPIDMDKHREAMAEVTGLPLLKDIEPGLVAHSPRELLQFFGTDYVRLVQDDFWVSTALSAVRNSNRDTVIADVRFQNEVEAIQKAGGVVVQIIRDRQDSTAVHVSEVLNVRPNAVFHASSGDMNLLRDFAYAAVSLVNGPRMFRVVEHPTSRGLYAADTYATQLGRY